MLPVRDLNTLHACRADLHGTVALVPTMGALHEGHLALIAEAKSRADHVIASIYVNPLQFGDASDLDRYPRDEEGDLTALARAGCDIAWLPDNQIMYPPGDATVIEPTGPALGWEGTARPGHFRGVATVVTKLLGQTRPNMALFGEKDWQQLQVIRRTTADLFTPVTIIGIPTMREHDGLAMSSRNRFLSTEQRAQAALLPHMLTELTALLEDGAPVEPILNAVRDALAEGGMPADYLSVTEAENLQSVTQLHDGVEYRLLAAVRLGSVRLLDNTSVRLKTIQENAP